MLTNKEKEEIIEKIKEKSMVSTFGYIIKEDELNNILTEYTFEYKNEIIANHAKEKQDEKTVN